jgi:hypothetical protein
MAFLSKLAHCRKAFEGITDHHVETIKNLHEEVIDTLGDPFEAIKLIFKSTRKGQLQID